MYRIFSKKNYFLIFLFVFIFLSFFIYNCFNLSSDYVYTYGFSYNISQGMVIYKDFDACVTPLCFFIGSFFIKIFGNYYFAINVLNALLIAGIGIICFKLIDWKAIGILPMFMVFLTNSYSLMCLFFLMLIIYLINIGREDSVWIGIICGLCLITKQNVGIMLFIPYFMYSKRKVKGIIAYLVPFLIISIYFVWNNALYEFIDHCFLAMLEFGGSNKYYVLFFACLELISIIYLIISLFKSKFKDRECFYILVFQIMSFPIMDAHHIFDSLIPIVYYLLKSITSKNISMLVCTLIITFNFSLVFVNYDVMFDNISYDKDNVHYLTKIYSLEKKYYEYIKEYLISNDYDLQNGNYFFSSEEAFHFKLYFNIPLNRYDMLNSGNCGYGGIKKKIEEIDSICKNDKCIFFIPIEFDYGQTAEFLKYVIDNYYLIDVFEDYNFYVYSNKENKQ